MKAVIFDMDGVISDTQAPAADVESRVLGSYGVAMSPEGSGPGAGREERATMVAEMLLGNPAVVDLETELSDL